MGSGMTDRFDPAKDAANLEKHGLSLLFGDKVLADESRVVLPSIRLVDGEERFKAIGLVDGRLFTAVYVWRGRWPRFISVRRSNRGEERDYSDPGRSE